MRLQFVPYYGTGLNMTLIGSLMFYMGFSVELFKDPLKSLVQYSHNRYEMDL